MAYENGVPCEFSKEDLVKPSLRHIFAAANLTFNEKVKAMIHSGRNVAHFGFGQSPFPVPEAFQEELVNFVHQNAYLPMKGILELREAIAEFHLYFDDIKLDPANLIVAPGSKKLIFMIMHIFNGGIDHLNSASNNGAKLLVLTNPGNPTGTCYTEQELRDISDCCRQNKVVILSDEIYARLTFNRKHCSMVKFYPEGTILTSGFSKWASAGGWRLGYAYIPPTMSSLYEAMMSYASNSYSCAPAPMQYAVAYALSRRRPELEEYMEDCSAILKVISDFCHRELALVGVSGKQSEAGYYFMPSFEVVRNGLRKRGILTGLQMTQAILEEADVALMAGEVFLRPSSELSVRFCFICFDGSETLQAYRQKKKTGTPLSQARKEEKERFIRENCKTLVDGIQRLKDWVLENKN